MAGRAAASKFSSLWHIPQIGADRCCEGRGGLSPEPFWCGGVRKAPPPPPERSSSLPIHLYFGWVPSPGTVTSPPTCRLTCHKLLLWNSHVPSDHAHFASKTGTVPPQCRFETLQSLSFFCVLHISTFCRCTSAGVLPGLSFPPIKGAVLQPPPPPPPPPYVGTRMALSRHPLPF